MDTPPREAVFGTRVRQRRMEQHLRQVDLALLIEEPQSYISRWESGDIQYMTLERLRRLARALHTSIDYLVGLPPCACSVAAGLVVPLTERSK